MPPQHLSEDDDNNNEGTNENINLHEKDNSSSPTIPTSRSPLKFISNFFRGSSLSQLKWLLGLGFTQWHLLLVGTVAMLISTVLGLVLPLFLTNLVDVIPQALTSEDGDEKGEKYLNTAALYLLLAVFGIAITTAIKHFCFSFAGERVVAGLRKELFETMIIQDVSFFDSTKTGELLNRLSSDTKSLEAAVTSNLFLFMRNVLQAIGGVFFLFYTSWKLTLVTMSVIPPIIFGAIIYGKIVKRLSKQVQDALAKSSEVAEESFSNLRTVRSFSKEYTHVSQYNVSIDDTLKLARKLSVSSGFFNGTMTFCATASIILVLWYGGSLVLKKEITIGLLTSFIIYTFYVATSLGVVSSVLFELVKAVGATARVHELLKQVPVIEKRQGKSAQTMDYDMDESNQPVSGHVEFRNVQFAYPSRPEQTVLKGVNIEMLPSTVNALVGKSGNGKSTISSLLQRFYDPNEGDILVDGKSIRELSPKELRKNIAVVQQEPSLFSCSIRENICYGWESSTPPTNEEIIDAATKANAHEFIMGFSEGYDTPVGERGIKLSGGQKQRIAIARAILKQARILILDEATSALDSNAEHQVQEALQRLMEGRTVLVIAHRLSTIKNANNIYVIDGGMVVEEGTHDQLMINGSRYKELVQRQLVSNNDTLE
ncbi:abc transporter [Naegleria gruberi]|uniref:Abc transporter n=1 Tax=Naegleria gruberi TaxID=5762 RepID=D2VKJ7_NAEGR|nr:abc transporter [Naegleria gruberi]EFC42701.1 abc transporter [Naegleria gruberi]|eukprot:XP_002675445.1 abc transporter [Naegleria gruberi strain NEG-M]